MSNETYWDKAKSEHFFNKAVSKEAENKTTSAIKLYQQSIKCWPKNAQANYNLGILFATIGKLNQALRAWKRAIWLDATLELELCKAFLLYDDSFETYQYTHFKEYKKAA